MVDYLTPSVPDARSRQHFSRDLGVHNMNVMAAKVVLIVVLGSIAVVGMLFGFTALATTAPGHEPDPVAYRESLSGMQAGNSSSLYSIILLINIIACS